MQKRAVRIGTPCHLDWQKMTPASGGRFCGDCKKVVRDLSSMREADARALLATPPTEGLCVRYMFERDGTVLFADTERLVPASLLARGKRVAAVAAMALSTAACSSTFGDGPDQVMGDYAGPDTADAAFVDGGTDDASTPDATPAPPGDAGSDDDASPDAGTTVDDASTPVDDAGVDGSAT